MGWSSCFIRYGIPLFLLYLYEKELPSKAAAAIARNIGFDDETDQCYALHFEKELVVESRKNKTSLFWTYFKRWKQYFPMEIEERKKYLKWAEKLCTAEQMQLYLDSTEDNIKMLQPCWR